MGNVLLRNRECQSVSEMGKPLLCCSRLLLNLRHALVQVDFPTQTNLFPVGIAVFCDNDETTFDLFIN